ncbi:TupA-like ATPgrasp [Peribacillus simplex]|uniref:TupA-like ATPgrasp n=1 Tax=Peribacillus simplex TaxID=1478 RepID=A0A9X8R3G0_9BACI|nr:ATP-grasp fold amidoligase family protein [Peribacillus simplex]SIQ22119.1 TupA-like ATPgrasp [Peribacillus simplex]
MIFQIKSTLRKISNRNKSIKKLYLSANKIKVRAVSKISDERFAKMKYKENTGKKLNLENPVLFNEKLWWLKINNRDPLLTICSDKYKVREYIKKCGLEQILTNIYGVYNNADEIKFEELPDKVFIKCNHGSGTNIIYDRNTFFDEEKFKRNFNYALKQNYYLQSREWNYKNIKPKLIVEEVLESEDNSSLIDYRFLCFKGKVKLIFVDIDTTNPDGSHSADARRNIYDTNFNHLNVKVGREHFDQSLVSKPQNLDKMIEYAEILSKPFPHCRVDLYNIKGKIYFGEITFYHGGGSQNITPLEWDKKMGSWIDIESETVVKK